MMDGVSLGFLANKEFFTSFHQIHHFYSVTMSGCGLVDGSVDAAKQRVRSQDSICQHSLKLSHCGLFPAVLNSHIFRWLLSSPCSSFDTFICEKF
jgi:hypothetical protein